MNSKLFVLQVNETCSYCPNYDYQWDSMGENGKQLCLASPIGPDEFEIDGYHNGFRIVDLDRTKQYNPKAWIPKWCPLPDVTT